VLNSTKDKKERISRLIVLKADDREEVDELRAGDLGAVLGLKDTTTGDTLCVDSDPIILESLYIPEPVISVAVEPKTKGDMEKLSKALQSLSEEDPTFRVRTDPETSQTVIAGMGELHLEILVDRMLREFRWKPTSARLRCPTAKLFAVAPKVRASSPVKPVARASTATW